MIDAIKRDRETGTPPEYGEWFWHGNGKTNCLSLATQGGGRHYVMDFDRWGMRGAQPRFQPRGEGMVDAKALLKFQVGDGSATGMEEAKADEGVYRYDIVAIDNPDARRIARIPQMEAALLAAVELADCVEQDWQEASYAEFVEMKDKLTAFRKALEAGQ